MKHGTGKCHRATFPRNGDKCGTQSWLTLRDLMDDHLPGSSVHEISQARILDRVAIPFSRGSSQPRDGTQISCIAGEFLTIWAAREAPKIPSPGMGRQTKGTLLGSSCLSRNPSHHRIACWSGSRFQLLAWDSLWIWEPESSVRSHTLWINFGSTTS